MSSSTAAIGRQGRGQGRGRGQRLIRPLVDFLHAESAGGIVLVAAALVGLVWFNSPWRNSFNDIWHSVLTIKLAGHGVSMDLRHWLNDGLMTLFFLLVGLEIKRELVEGELSDRRSALLPAVGALGGMVVPAALFLALAGGTSASAGWGIPMATDIALAVGVLSLLGQRVPSSAKVFLLALAIVDDIGAILVIALFYSKGLNLWYLLGCVAVIAVAPLLRRCGVHQLWPFALVGATAWFLCHEAGVHATLVGVVMGLMAPVEPFYPADAIDADDLGDLSTVEAAAESVDLARGSVSTVEWLEHRLHPWTSFVIVPLFALANMGVEISGSTLSRAVHEPAAGGIALGLVIGKPLGITLAVAAAVKLGGLVLPEGMNLGTVARLGALAGIGFTVSIFVTELAYDDHGLIDAAKLAVLVASLVAAVVGAAAFMAGRSSSTSTTDTVALTE